MRHLVENTRKKNLEDDDEPWKRRNQRRWAIRSECDAPERKASEKNTDPEKENKMKLEEEEDERPRRVR